MHKNFDRRGLLKGMGAASAIVLAGSAIANMEYGPGRRADGSGDTFYPDKAGNVQLRDSTRDLTLKTLTDGGWAAAAKYDQQEMPMGTIQCGIWTIRAGKIATIEQPPIRVAFAINPKDPSLVTLMDPKTNSTIPPLDYWVGRHDITKIDVSSLTGESTLLTFLAEDTPKGQKQQAQWRYRGGER